MGAVSFRAPYGVVPALDVDSVADMKRVVAATCDVPGVVGYKLGMAGALRLGLAGAVQAIREITDLPILYDHQKAGPDIPDMAKKYAALCRECGVDGLILFPLAGPGAVREFVVQSLAQGLLPIVGGDFPLAEYRVSGGGYVTDDGPERIWALAAECGADHFVVPATNAGVISRVASSLKQQVESPVLFLPGIGALGGAIGDAFAAAPGCRCYAIVGRAIVAAADPRAAAERLSAEALSFAR